MKPLLLILLTAIAARAETVTFGELNITIPDGFSIERIASTDLIPRPISAAFDDKGRLYVTDSGGMSDKADMQLKTKPHRLLRLIDSDNDGVFDKKTVFADKLMFPEGCLYYEGSVYVAAPPEIWKFTDADDDGVAEKREVWFDGKTLTGCGNDLHGPYLGRDGWFYWTKGAFAEQHYTLPNGKPFVTTAAHIFRARPDATMIEPILTGGMDNPVGLTFTRSGERILSGTFFWTPAAGERDGLIHSIYGGVYGKSRPGIYDHPLTGALMPNLTQMGAAAPCGITTLVSDQLGSGFRDSVLTCYFNLHKIVRHELDPSGATFRTKEIDLVASTHPDFHPTDIIEDADGSLIVIDTGGWYKICCPTSQLAKPDVLGGIYRLRSKSMTAVEDARGEKIPWSQSSPDELAKLLNDPRPAVQQRAIRSLGHRSDSIAALSHVLKNGSQVAKQNALWSLARTSERSAIHAALQDSDPAVVQPALHLIALTRDATARSQIEPLLNSKHEAISRGAAEALGRIGSKDSVPALLAATAKLAESDPSIEGSPSAPAARIAEHSLIYALIEVADAASTVAGLQSASIITRRAALVALDQMKPCGLQAAQVTPLLNDNDITLRRTAAWIVGHHPEWGETLASYFRERLSQSPADDTLAQQLAQLASSPVISDLIASSRSITVLRAMTLAAPRETPTAWLDAITEVLRQSDAATRGEAIIAAHTLALPKGGHQPLRNALIQVGEDSANKAQQRLDALAAAKRLPQVSIALFDFLLSHLMPDQPVAARTAAVTVFANATLTPEQQLTLADALGKVGPLELPKLLPAFERGANATLGQRLVSALQNASGFNGLRADLLKTLFDKYPSDIQAAAQPLLLRLNADIAKQAEQLAALLENLPTGDTRRGQAVFMRGGCIACHRIGYGGGTIGPDVTNIGKVRTTRDLLEAIVFPSASIVRGYEIHTVTAKTGESFTGTIAKEDRAEVILNTAPGLTQRITRDLISEMKPISISIMPQGFGDLLKPQDLADLLAFLQPPPVSH